MNISVSILTKNSEKYLEEVLQALSTFEEVLILDNGSTDKTLSLAKKYKNVTIKESAFIGFGPLHNLAIDLARNDWILSLDSDEILTSELLKEIQNTKLESKKVYSFAVKNYYNGKWIRHCGWYPDRHVRLFSRESTRFTDAYVHEGVITKGLEEHRFKNAIKHYSYSNTEDFLRKMQQYSQLFAEQNKGKKKSSLKKAILHGLGAFIKTYLVKKGFLDGYEGFIISVYNANTAFYKYLKLKEENEKESCSTS